MLHGAKGHKAERLQNTDPFHLWFSFAIHIDIQHSYYCACTWIIMKPSQQNFTHCTKALLSWHAENFRSKQFVKWVSGQVKEPHLICVKIVQDMCVYWLKEWSMYIWTCITYKPYCDTQYSIYSSDNIVYKICCTEICNCKYLDLWDNFYNCITILIFFYKKVATSTI